ncbi:MAG: fatty acid desaturase [Rhizobiaceae bacterium]|nr:fatty acid desaturase [Rhizobiaceae bacterium]
MTEPSLTHVELIASLSDDERQILVEKSDRAGLLRIGSHVFMLGITGSWIIFGWPLWQIAMIVHGILLSFLFSAEHESIHGTAFKTYWLNVWTARLSGLVLLLPPQWFRYFHFAHHRHTNDQERDPELASPRPSTLGQYIWHVSGIPYWFSQMTVLLRNASGTAKDSFVPGRGKARVQKEAFIYLLIYAFILILSFVFDNWIALYLWVIPALLGQPFLRLALLAEHLFCPHETNMLKNSRTTFTTNAVRWITWNMAFHAEHHSYPAVPFYKLPAFHKYTKDHTLVQQDGYANFHTDAISRFVIKAI